MTINRRQFLKRTGAVVVGATSIYGSAYTRREGAWPQETEQFSLRQAKSMTLQEQRMTRFGIQIEPQFGFTFSDVVDLAKEAERLGFTALWASDHLLWDAKSERRNCLDVWALMPALASGYHQVTPRHACYLQFVPYPQRTGENGSECGSYQQRTLRVWPWRRVERY